MRAAIIVAALAACGGPARHPLPAAASNDLTLYRDVAVVRQRIELQLPATPTTVTVHVAAGVTGDQLVVIDRGGVELRAVHVAATTPTATTAAEDETPGGDTDAEAADGGPAPAPATDVILDVTAPHAGTYALVLSYPTNRLSWDADYTMTTTSARTTAILHGALAVRNTAAIAFDHAVLHVIDADLASWRTRTAESLATALVGGTPSTTPAATPRDLGIASLVEGETRVEIAGISTPRPMHAVLVYDPIGTRLDNTGGAPVREPTLGVVPAAPGRITESFEIQRDEQMVVGLPAGPVRLLERRGDGSLGVLGEARLFDAATRVAQVDTIAVGTAEGVTGHRERRELTIDNARGRLTEEFMITLDNARDHDVGVLVREHMYRGQNWVLAYDSTKQPAKEGAQQISLRSAVPAKSQHKILYVVVYTWTP